MRYHHLDVVMKLTASIQHMGRYLVAGGIATVFDLAIFSLCTHLLGINYLIATVIAVTVATAVKFVLCLNFVFQLRERTKIRAWWYQLAASFFALVLNLLIMFLFVDMLHFDRLHFLVDGLLLARGITTGLVFIVNFTLAKYIIYKDY